ncbi:hypothetical protein R3P38DRAFT_2812160 [Favolaschia claudopus]|uniref:Uncharacterized protein n=1 Tax=Favolaschia claudopus TaxID=2862362 RepID=A0AAV9Z865_9AGAR
MNFMFPRLCAEIAEAFTTAFRAPQLLTQIHEVLRNASHASSHPTTNCNLSVLRLLLLRRRPRIAMLQRTGSLCEVYEESRTEPMNRLSVSYGLSTKAPLGVTAAEADRCDASGGTAGHSLGDHFALRALLMNLLISKLAGWGAVEPRNGGKDEKVGGNGNGIDGSGPKSQGRITLGRRQGSDTERGLTAALQVLCGSGYDFYGVTRRSERSTGRYVPIDAIYLKFGSIYFNTTEPWPLIPHNPKGGLYALESMRYNPLIDYRLMAACTGLRAGIEPV